MKCLADADGIEYMWPLSPLRARLHDSQVGITRRAAALKQGGVEILTSDRIYKM